MFRKFAGIILVLGLLAFSAIPISASESFIMRISTENQETHFQTRIVDSFASALAQRSQGRIDVRFSPGAQMFKDRDVIQALQREHVEMAVPGTWQIDRMVPDVGLFLLPMFYGHAIDTIHSVVDGKTGIMVARRIAQDLQVEVLGRWIDLGFAHIFGSGHPIRTYEDLIGKRIRVAGGQANLARLEVLGASAFVVPWPDLPEALSLGKIDGTLTSFETVASAQLWHRGINSAFMDRQYFAQYVPLVSRSFWNRLPLDLREIMRMVWDEQVDPARELAAAAQATAREMFEKNGGVVAEPSVQDRGRIRSELLKKQDELVTTLGIDRALVDLTMRALK